MKKPSKKPRTASIYLVRYSDIRMGKVINFVDLFFNKKQALNFQRYNGGVLTRWSYQEQIVIPKKRIRITI